MGRAWRNLKAVAAIGVLAAAAIWCGYGMRYSSGARGIDPQLVSVGSVDVQIMQVICAAHLLPENYLEGLVGSAHSGRYFCRRGLLLRPTYAKAPWYFFPVTMAVKFTLAFLAMLAMGGAGFVLIGRELRREFVSCCCQRCCIWR